MQSFKDIDNWLTEADKNANENVIKLLVGNKNDLESKRQVSFQEGKELADSLGIKFIETSALNSSNVETAFITLATEIKSRVQKPTDNATIGGGSAKTGGASNNGGKTKIRAGGDVNAKKSKEGCC